MSVVWQIVYAVLASVPCLWFALFVLSWRDARERVELGEVSEPVQHPMPRPRPVDYFTILPLYWLIFFLIWPGFVGNWLGRRRRRRPRGFPVEIKPPKTG